MPKRVMAVNPFKVFRKGHHSINVQACISYNYCFFDVVVKQPGSVRDARIWGNSSINQILKDGTIPECFKVIVDGEDPVPVCILGDPAYPLLGYLMKEFSSGGITPEEEFFSYRLPSARMVVACAFGRLKGRFGILRKDIYTDLKTTLNIIYACFVLHNFCEMNKEQLLDGVVSTAIHNNKNMQPPTQNYCYSRGTGNDIKGKRHKPIFVKYFE